MISVDATAGTVLADVRFKLHGDRQKWLLRDASAITPFGLAKADGSIGAAKPFKLDATASLTQLQPKAGQKPAQLNLRASGDLTATELAANGQSGAAVGDAKLTLAPFEPIPLRAMTINGRGIDPAFLNPALPNADLTIAVAATHRGEPRRHRQRQRRQPGPGRHHRPAAPAAARHARQIGRQPGGAAGQRRADRLRRRRQIHRQRRGRRAPGRQPGSAPPTSCCIPTAST